MPLVARGPEGYTLAHAAKEKTPYACPSCGHPMRLRKGKYIRHFYHLRKTPACRLYSKEEDHLFFQWDLHSKLPPGEASLEVPFPTIQRVADVSWEKEGIVFEIQCSLLSLFEAQKRVLDYKKAGFDVVWILDDRTFNRRKATPAEEWIRTQGGLYLHFSRANLSCLYYDQFEVIFQGKRRGKSRPYKANLSRPLRGLKSPPPLAPRCMKRDGSLFFQGDLLGRWAEKSLSPLEVSRWALQERLLSKQKRRGRLSSWKEGIAHFLKKWTIKAYKNF